MIAEQHEDSTADGSEHSSRHQKYSKRSSCCNLPRGKSPCRIAPGVTAVRVGQKAELHVNQPFVADFSTNDGPNPAENGVAKRDEAVFKDNPNKNGPDQSEEDVKESAETPSEVARNVLKAIETACKYCDSLASESGEEAEYECSESESEPDKKEGSPEYHSEDISSTENANQEPKEDTGGSLDNPVDLTSESEEAPALAAHCAAEQSILRSLHEASLPRMDPQLSA